MKVVGRPLEVLRERFARRGLALRDWSTQRVEEWLDTQRAQLASIVPGEVVALPLANAPEAALGLSLLLERGAACLVLPGEVTAEEQQRALALVGGGRNVVWTGVDLQLLGSPHTQSAWSTPCVLLPTSGSSGVPKLVHRSLDSVLLEAERYVSGVGLEAGARVLLLAPISHAYALGWLAAAFLADGLVALVTPTHLDAAIRMMASGVDWVVLTPALARLLSLRRMPGGLAPDFGPLRVMAGAGPVDAALEQAFERRFGVGLWRNYGSSETGAVLMGGPGLPDGCVGRPPPGIAVRVVAANGEGCEAEEVGRLMVALEDGVWRDTGDLGSVDRDGRFTIRGRTSRSVRRGERWISPAEIEHIANAEPGVRRARASGVPRRRTGDDLLVLEIWPDSPTDFDSRKLVISLRAQLPASHWPDEIRARGRLRRTHSGKIPASPRYRRADHDSLLAAARAYKRTELLFALMETGVLQRLDGAQEVDELAAALGLDALALEVALEQAELLGIVASDGASGPELGEAQRRILEMERLLSISWTTRRQIADTLRAGIARRPVGDLSSLRPVYMGALHGDAVRFRVRLGLRRARVGPGARLLEVTTGPGDYLVEALSRWPDCGGRLWQVGDLHGPAHPALEQLIGSGRIASGPPAQGERYTACVIFNAIHGHAAAGNLGELLSMVQPGGVLLVDDLFLADDVASAEFGLDWLTHGGVSFQTAGELRERLMALAGSADLAEIPGSRHACHLVAALGDPQL